LTHAARLSYERAAHGISDRFQIGPPIHLQIIDEVKAAAASGALRPGEALPSIGALAAELRVNRNAISKAYTELANMGVVDATPGQGYVLTDPQDPSRNDRRRRVLMADGDRQNAASSFTVRRAWLYALVQRGAHYLGLAGRAEFSRALKAIKTAGPTQADLAGFIALATSTAEEALGAHMEFVGDYGALLSLVTSFPALRSANVPVRAGNEMLVPIFSDNELTGVLQISRKSAGQEYDPEELEFLSEVAEQIGTWSNHFRLRKERQEGEYALDIQRGLLPREIPQAQGFSIAGSWQPARTVGGDYYDVFNLTESKFALVVADVSGKGIPAALLMANLQATVKAYATDALSPAEICVKVNRAVCSSITVGRFITFFYAELDTANRRLSYVNAGHNPGILTRRNGSCVTLESGGPILGVLPNAAYEGDAVGLNPGDRLVIYTDGITEAIDPAGEEFGEERLIRLVGGAGVRNATQLQSTIMNTVGEFCRNEFSDDATLLAVCIE
jgi:serine phosphatase RsbU (regulator of sigma subunit)/DNA-binding transcriptional regulator YhcF (GntR family)